MPKIAVEQPFTDIQQALKDSGFQADMLNQKTNAAHYDVVVVRNLESYDDVHFEGSLVEASGRTIYEVVKEVEKRLQRAGKIKGEPAALPAAVKNEGGSRFLAGFISGVAIGSVVALFVAPKSGKELQVTLKDKLASNNSDGNESNTLSQVKEKATDLAKAAKEKATEATTQVKEKVSGSSKEDQETVKETNSSSAEKKQN